MEAETIPRNTTGFRTISVEAKRLHLNKKPGNSVINKTPTFKSIQIQNNQ
jgi:hypothetical protein